MKHPLVTGLQFGDEGKGKITDVLAKQADWVIRFNGGNNAGHTLWLNGKKLVTHSVPSGVLYSHTKNFIGAGCVVDPVALTKELAELSGAGASLSPSRLQIDFRAHVTFPIHLALDSGREAGAQGIGTTKRGIGPTYTSKVDRSGLRVGTLYDKEAPERLAFLCKTYNSMLRDAGAPESPLEDNLKILKQAQELFAPYMSRELTPFYKLAQSQKCLLEGAQGIALDIDHGTFPFVTSSNTIPAYAAIGTPFPQSKLGSVIGVMKAYLTRVGSGPFVTELNDATGERIRKNGKEFGATTGRPRRTGWLNLDEVKDAVALSDCTYIVMTKSDILMGEPTVAAFIDGELKQFNGWKTMIDGSALNPDLENYIQAIEKHVGVPVIAVGTGAERDDLFWRKPIQDFWHVS